MSDEKILCAGFGGQGIMSLGKLLAYSGMLAGKQVTWMPSYGPEMRGGTAYCSVVVSDKPVGSPIVTSHATSLIVMNLPSFDKFEHSVTSGGLIVMNSSLIDRKSSREDVTVYGVKANDLAAQCGNPRAANMIMLGTYMALKGEPRLEHVVKALKKVFEIRSSALIDLNIDTLRCGMDLVTMPTEPRQAA
ncbi:MAG: 2-oxoacid:acceptor oxidoreductase family protein [Desulfofustis sp.]|jgi:2-oxoglutarate ferredoxin oxidoreductase subunit gamma|nr:2-oxoacid:acceptor oxidoreductase family protein [Desulfofustis sp.]